MDFVVSRNWICMRNLMFLLLWISFRSGAILMLLLSFSDGIEPLLLLRFSAQTKDSEIAFQNFFSLLKIFPPLFFCASPELSFTGRESESKGWRDLLRLRSVGWRRAERLFHLMGEINHILVPVSRRLLHLVRVTKQDNIFSTYTGVSFRRRRWITLNNRMTRFSGFWTRLFVKSFSSPFKKLSFCLKKENFVGI